jgi:hypothetical protein
MQTCSINGAGLLLRTRSKKKRLFKPTRAAMDIEELAGELPDDGTSYRMLSVEGGFCSLSLILWVASKVKINELTVSSLRIGEKHIKRLDELYRNGRLGKARFIVAQMIGEMRSERKSTAVLMDITFHNGWQLKHLNNHSKILLMDTDQGKYVVETSSNLNQNPKIEQYTMERSSELYDWYYGFFTGDER